MNIIQKAIKLTIIFISLGITTTIIIASFFPRNVDWSIFYGFPFSFYGYYSGGLIGSQSFSLSPIPLAINIAIFSTIWLVIIALFNKIIFKKAFIIRKHPTYVYLSALAVSTTAFLYLYSINNIDFPITYYHFKWDHMGQIINAQFDYLAVIMILITYFVISFILINSISRGIKYLRKSPATSANP